MLLFSELGGPSGGSIANLEGEAQPGTLNAFDKPAGMRFLQGANMKKIIPLSVSAAIGLLLQACTTMTPTAAYNPPAYKPHNPCNVKVKVSLSKQTVYVKEGDRMLMAAACCVGIPAKPTPHGNFTIFSKQPTKRSGSYGFSVTGNGITPCEAGKSHGRYVGYPMPYWCEFSPAYGFHAGYVWPVPRTHGCIRLHKNVAPKFFELVRNGTPVNISQSQPEDSKYASLPRPQDFRDDDPPAALMISSAAFAKPAGPLLIEQ